MKRLSAMTAVTTLFFCSVQAWPQAANLPAAYAAAEASAVQAGKNLGLFQAVRRGDPAAVEKALDSGAQVDAWDGSFFPTPDGTPIEYNEYFCGPRSGQIEDILIKHGANLTRQDGYGQNVLTLASAVGCAPAVSVLVSNPVIKVHINDLAKAGTALDYATAPLERDKLARSPDATSLERLEYLSPESKAAQEKTAAILKASGAKSKSEFSPEDYAEAEAHFQKDYCPDTRSSR
ncbi:MAG TPA: hypothetical protein VNH15_04495 [Elusimicrobiota bacterium]|nr:hypothetical protein [Elusimicrobiota bacterium]